MNFKSFWYGPDLPLHVHACLASFIAHGHTYTLYCYGKYRVPSGVVLADARTILPEEDVFYYTQVDGRRGSVSGFSNLFRYKLLLREGGWWVDTDVLCLGPTVPDRDLFVGSEGDSYANSAILKIPAGHPLAQTLTARAAALGKSVVHGQTGPKLVTTTLAELGLEDCIEPQSSAYPVRYSEFRLPVVRGGLDDVSQRVAGVPFLHLWQEMFRLDGSDLLDCPERGSYLDRVFRRHLPLSTYGKVAFGQAVRALRDRRCARNRGDAPLDEVKGAPEP